MKIGVIGIGQIGGTLARTLASAQHEVTVVNSKNDERARDFANKVGASADSLDSIVRRSELIILSIPFPAISLLENGLIGGFPAELPLVDTSNYHPGMRDPIIPGVDESISESNWVSDHIGRPVIKAFSDMPFYSLSEFGLGKGHQDRIATTVFGDNVEHKQIVMELIDEDVGFDPIDGGTLDESWRAQPGSRVFCCDWSEASMREMLARDIDKAGLIERRSKSYDVLASWGAKPDFIPSHDDLIALMRSLYDER